MKKVLLVATVQSHIAQFHKPLILMLKENGYEVHVAARDNLAEKNGLQLNEPDKVFNISFDRSPLSKNNIAAYRDLNRILSENKYDVVHCNTPMGGIVTRLAANKYRKIGTKVFYTAHGFHFYKGAPIKNWIIYYPIEKWFARYTDKLITISYEDYNLAIIKKFKTKIEHIHGVGANTEKFCLPSDELIYDIRVAEGFKSSDFICICTGELNKNKNQLTLLKAVPEIIKDIPDFKLLLAGNGPMGVELKKFIESKELKDRVSLLGYRSDLERYVKLSNVVVSVSIREGLGLNLIEAMLCGKPIVGSLNRGHNELITDGENGFLVKPNDGNGIKDAIVKIYRNIDLQNTMKQRALELSQKYKSEKVVNELKKIYEIWVED